MKSQPTPVRSLLKLGILPLLLLPSSLSHAQAVLPGIHGAIDDMIFDAEITGAVTAVVTSRGIVHLEAVGFRNREEDLPMTTDTVFAIHSMTKPLVGISILMLEDDGLLSIDDYVRTHIPEFEELKQADGSPIDLKIVHLLTHTSGLGEIPGEWLNGTAPLSELITEIIQVPMLFQPGEDWEYCQSGINVAAHLVERISGKTFSAFIRERILEPIGMKDTTFQLNDTQVARLATAYMRGEHAYTLDPWPDTFADWRIKHAAPRGHSGLFSTAEDYARLCLMLLNRGTYNGKRILSEDSVAKLASTHTQGLLAGFLPGSAWGLAVGIVEDPMGDTSMLNPGTYGHGGAHGTQAWIDPIADAAYILMIQRTDFPNSDGSEVRAVFQQSASRALSQR